MKNNLARFILKSARKQGLTKEECRVYRNYSGRGMFGATTTAITVDSQSTLLSIVAGLPKATKAIKQLRSDNLGRDMIYY